MKKIKRISTLGLSSLLAVGMFTACGGGDASSYGGTTSTDVSGKVADGYLVGAKVCLDKNTNGVCDEGEPYTLSTLHGDYKFTDVSSADFKQYPIVAEITPNVIDEDTNMPVLISYNLSAVPGERFISPISSIVKQYVDDGQTKEAATAYVASLFGLDAASVVKDYVAENMDEVHTAARAVAQLKYKIYDQIVNVNQSGMVVEPSLVNAYTNLLIKNEFEQLVNQLKTNTFTFTQIADNLFSIIDTSGYEEYKKSALELNDIGNTPAPSYEEIYETNALYNIIFADDERYVENAIGFEMFDSLQSSKWYQFKLTALFFENGAADGYVTLFDRARLTSETAAPKTVQCYYDVNKDAEPMEVDLRCEAYDKDNNLLFTDETHLVGDDISVQAQIAYVTNNGYHYVTTKNPGFGFAFQK